MGVTPTALAVNEGANAGYTVVLATLPTGPVTVTATVPPGNPDVSVTPASRTFTRDDWYTPKAFTVAHTGDDDGTDDAAVAIGQDATGGGYGPVAIDAVTATFADPDTAGLVFMPAAVTVIEQDPDGASYTVALATEPTDDVTVTAPPGAVYVHTTSFVTSALTFTPSDWDTAQTVNVDALHDNNADDERLTLNHAVTGGDYTAWALAAPPGARSVALNVEDNDIASTAVTLTVAPAEVDEDAGASAVTVTGMLDGVPRGSDTTVTVTVSAGSGAGGAEAADFVAVTAFPLTITAGSRSGTAGFTFTPVDDDVDEGDETAIVGGSAAGLAVVAAELAIGEDDARGIVLSKTAVTVTEEDGAGASYTVALTSEPTGPVTVFADPPAGSGVRIAPASLTFPAADWDDPQTFTVSAVHDADGMDETGLAIAHRVAGADYAGHSVADTVAVTIVDDDIRDVVVSALSAAIAEGESATYTVKLNTEPSGPVTVTLTPAPDNSELTLAPASLAFDTGDWGTARTVTVTASHDDDAIADPPFAIAHAASGGDYAGVVSSTDPLEVTVTEDDMEGFAVVPTALTVAEEATGTFAVALTSAPAGTVEVEAAVSGDNEVTVTPAALIFDASNWDDAQTFTVAAGDDTDSDDDTATVTVRVKSGSYGAPDVPVAVTVDDNDDPSTKVTLTVAPAKVAEDAGATAVTVTGMLDGAPREDDTQVIVTVSDGPIQSRAEADEFVPVSAFVLTIAPGSRTGMAEFTFTPVDNDVDGPDRKVSVYGAIVGSSISVEPVELLILDDDTRGVAVTPSSVTVTEEDGTGASYTVRLESQPTGSVTVHADPPAGTAVRVTPASRTFTPTTWNTPQAFTVSAVHDADSVDETGLAIAHRVTGADYQGDTVDATVAVTVIDDDIPGIHVVPAPDPAPDPVTVDEGMTLALSVSLNTQPSGPVTVTLTPTPDNSELSFSPATLTFGTGDWETAKTVEVMAAQDDDGRDDEFTITALAASASDNGYDGISKDFALTIIDNDTEAILVAPIPLELGEGASGMFEVRLGSAPASGPVGIGAAMGAGSDAHVTLTPPVSRTFNAMNWDEPQTFTVSAAEDSDSIDDLASVEFSVSQGTYGAPAVTAAVVVTDNDQPSTEVTLTLDTDGVAEDAGATVVTVTGTLDAAPEGTDTMVTVTVSAVSGADGAEAADFEPVTPFTLTIDAGETEGTADFTFTPVDDDVDEGDETVAVGGSATGLTVVAAELAIRENDMRGIELSKTAVTVTEGETTGKTYGVTLASEPTGNVTVFADAPTGTDVRVAPASRIFTPSSWEMEQTFAVTAVDDPDSSDISGLAIAHRVAGADYAGHGVADTVAVTIVEDDVPGLHVETEMDATEIDEDGTLDLRVKLDTLPSGPVTVTLTPTPTPTPSDSELTLSPGSLTFTTTGTGNWNTLQTVTVTTMGDDDAPDDQFTIVLAASGGGYGGITEDFALTVTDPDEETIVVTPIPLEFGEGASGEFAVKLGSAPASGTVRIAAAMGAGSDEHVTLVTPVSRSFNANNWSDTKTFTVRAAEDDDAMNDMASVEFSVSQGTYGAPDVTAGVVVTDNDQPSSEVTLTVDPAGVAGDAGATTVTVTGTLDAAPRGADTAVTVSVTAGSGADGAEAADFEPVTPFTLTIDAGETVGTETFTFTPVDDDVDEGDETVAVGGSAGGLTVEAADLAIREDDARGIVLSKTAVSPTEGEATGETYGVTLASEPTGNVTVFADAPTGTDVRVAPASRIFTPSSWEMEQTFAVTAVDDPDSSDISGLAIAHRVAGADYAGHGVADTVAVTIVDDDVPGLHVETEMDATEIDEDGTLDLRVKLDTLPSGPVTVTLTPTPTPTPSDSELTLSPGSLTFTTTGTGNWNTLQTVTVTTMGDDDAPDDQFTIVLAASGGGYGGITEDFALTVTDPDEETIVVTPIPLEFGEGASGEFAVKLGAAPASGTVRIAAAMGAGSDEHVTLVTPVSRSFNANNWSDTKTFTVRAAEDDDAMNDMASVEFSVSQGTYGAPDVTAGVVVTDSTGAPGAVLSSSTTTTSTGAAVTPAYSPVPATACPIRPSAFTLSVLSSTGVTVTVFGLSQSPDVNTRLAGLTVTPPASAASGAGVTVTSWPGSVASTTV